MIQDRNRVWWWLGVAVVVNLVICVGVLVGDPVSALMVVAGIAPAAAALHHFLRFKRKTKHLRTTVTKH
jgi:uncharacterized membrane protein YesL